MPFNRTSNKETQESSGFVECISESKDDGNKKLIEIVEEKPRLEKWPPPFFELGKRARNLVVKGYDFGLLKLDCTIKTPDNVTFNTSCVKNIEQDKLFGSFEGKCEFSNSGFTFSEKWNTDNVLLAELSYKNNLIKGLKLSLASVISPSTGDKKAVVKGELREICALNADLEFGDKISLLTSSIVLGHQGIIGGFQTKFDLGSSKITDYSVAGDYSNANFILHTIVRNGSDCGGSVFHKVTPSIDAGINIEWSTEKSDTVFGIRV